MSRILWFLLLTHLARNPLSSTSLKATTLSKLLVFHATERRHVVPGLFPDLQTFVFGWSLLVLKSNNYFHKIVSFCPSVDVSIN